VSGDRQDDQEDSQTACGPETGSRTPGRRENNEEPLLGLQHRLDSKDRHQQAAARADTATDSKRTDTTRQQKNRHSNDNKAQTLSLEA
jgi:hypothetical protein